MNGTSNTPPSHPSGKVRCVSTLALRVETRKKLQAGVTPATQSPNNTKKLSVVRALQGDLPYSSLEVAQRLALAAMPPSPVKGQLPNPQVWSVIKYANFFELVGRQLHASSTAVQYAGHAKTRNSDELGEGVCLLSAEKWIKSIQQGGAVDFLALDYVANSVWRTGKLGYPPGSTSKMQPDFILEHLDNRNPQTRTFYLAESKGTFGPKSFNNHTETLSKAIQQVSNVTIDGNSVPSLATRSVLGPGQVQVWSLDPPETSISTTVTESDLTEFISISNRIEAEQAKIQERRREPSADTDKNLTIDLPVCEVALAFQKAAFYRLALWSGNARSLALLGGPSLEHLSPVRFSAPYDDARGVWTRVSLNSNKRYEIFTGVPENLFNSLEEGAYSDAFSEISSWAKGTSSTDRGTQPRRGLASDGWSTDSISYAPNGTIMALRS